MGESAAGVRVGRAELEAFCARTFARMGAAPEAAALSAEVLVAADAAGIPSHGVARLGRYVEGLRTGLMDGRAEPRVVSEGPTSLVLDARGALGAPVSVRAMGEAVRRARSLGAGFACVRDSNHFGIAGYYARMALPEGMIGLAMTNTAALGVPTFGSAAMFGTNPLAFAAPAGREIAFVLDMSTTVVTRGKIEVCARERRELPEGWAVDGSGEGARDAAAALRGFQAAAGGILPLGGAGTLYGGHKGYGLAVMVDVLCAVLSGSPFGAAIRDTESSSARVSHFFGAIDVAAFRDPGAFRADMDAMLAALRSCPPARGAGRVWFAGLRELEAERDSEGRGVPVSGPSWDALAAIGSRLGVALPPLRAESAS